MPRIVNNPKICPNCNHVWQSIKRTTTVKGKKYDYAEVVHLDNLPKLGLKKGICNDCR